MYTINLNEKNDRLVELIEKVMQGEEVKIFSVQDKNLKSWEGKGLIGVSRKPKKPS